MSQIHPLTKPIQAHGETVHQLSLRAPSSVECRQIGLLPYFMTSEGIPNPNLGACAQYIAKCAQIPPSSVDQLELDDLHALAWVIVRFFWKPEPEQTAATGANSSNEPSTT